MKGGTGKNGDLREIRRQTKDTKEVLCVPSRFELGFPIREQIIFITYLIFSGKSKSNHCLICFLSYEDYDVYIL